MKNPVVFAAVASLFSLTSSLAFAQVVTSVAAGPEQTPTQAGESAQEQPRSTAGRST